MSFFFHLRIIIFLYCFPRLSNYHNRTRFFNACCRFKFLDTKVFPMRIFRRYSIRSVRVYMFWFRFVRGSEISITFWHFTKASENSPASELISSRVWKKNVEPDDISLTFPYRAHLSYLINNPRIENGFKLSRLSRDDFVCDKWHDMQPSWK